MRFFKRTVFWFIILAVVGGAFYLIDRRVEEKKVVEDIKKRLFSFDTQDVVEIQVVRKDENIIIRKEQDKWALVNPIVAAADKEAVEQLLKAVINVRYDATLFETQTPEKLKEMGITGKDDLSVTFKIASGLVKTIVFGDRNPTMNLGFAILKDDQRIFRLTADIRAEADKKAYDLRDKTVIAFEPLKIKNIEYKWQGSEAVFVSHPEEGKWHIIRPKNAIADALKMTEILLKLKEARIKAFIDESPKDLGAYGFTQPRLSINITDGKGRHIGLLVGERDKKQRGLFAKTKDALNVFLLEEDFMADLPKTYDDLEEKEIEKTMENKK